MLHRIKTLAASLRNAFRRSASRGLDATITAAPMAARSLRRALPPLLMLTAVTAAGYGLVPHPPRRSR